MASGSDKYKAYNEGVKKGYITPAKRRGRSTKPSRALEKAAPF